MLETFEVAAIWLLREGDHAVVKVQLAGGSYVEVIREHVEGPFSHCVHASGIRACVEGTGSVPLTEKADAPAKCKHCDGSGHSHGWPGVISSPCKFCNGTGGER